MMEAVPGLFVRHVDLTIDGRDVRVPGRHDDPRRRQDGWH